MNTELFLLIVAWGSLFISGVINAWVAALVVRAYQERETVKLNHSAFFWPFVSLVSLAYIIATLK